MEQRLGTTIGVTDRYIVRLVRNNTGTAARNNILAMARKQLEAKGNNNIGAASKDLVGRASNIDNLVLAARNSR